MKTQRNITLKRTLFTHLLLIAGAVLLLFGGLMSAFLYISGVDNAYAAIRNKNKATTNFIKGYFTPLRSAVKYLADHPDVIHAANNHFRQKDRVLSLFETLKNSIPNIYYIYSGYAQETLLINGYSPPKDYDPRTRPWYRAALRAAPDISGGIPYREIKTKEWLVSFSKTLVEDTAAVCGVVAIDTSVKAVTQILSAKDPAYSSAYSFVLNDKKKVIIHPRSDLLGKSFNRHMETRADLSSPEGRLQYTFEQTNKIAYYTRLDSMGWIVVTTVDKSEILAFVATRILISIAVAILVTLLLGQIMSRTLSRNIIAPLQTLEQQVKTSVSRSSQTGEQTGSPPSSSHNEIDSIAGAIEQITEKALFRKNQELEAKNELLEQLSRTDPLTGLLNRRKIHEDLESEYRRAKRYGTTFSIILIDIDWFKHINDTYGHHAGDRVLEELARLLEKTLRAPDRVARWGGEEFLILCPETRQADAGVVARRIHAAVGLYQFSVPGKISISVGITGYQATTSLDDLLVAVDQKLYEAKAQGRNRVVD